MAGCPAAIIICLIMFTLVIREVTPCSVTEEWTSLPVAQRITKAKIVVYGYVTAHYPIKQYDGEEVFPIDQAYTAEMELYCLFKGGPLPDKINITNVGEYTSCSMTNLPIGKEYIVLLQLVDQDYEPDDVNLETAAFPPTDANFYYVSKDPGIEVTVEACTNYSGNDTIACFQTGIDHESCDGVAGLKTSISWYFLVLLTWFYI